MTTQPGDYVAVRPHKKIEYIRADLLQQPTSERCGDVVATVRRIVNKHGNCNQVGGGLTCKVRILAALEREVAATGTGEEAQRELLHWRLRAGVEETMCGLSMHSGAGAALLPEAATCPECKAAFVGYKFGRADATPPAPSAAPEAPCNHERELGKKVLGCFDCYPPSTTATSEPAKEASINAAATEICDYCGIDTNDGEKVAAIISKHCVADAGEVERLRAERLEIQRALASTVLEDPTEDDNPPYTTSEIVHGITSLEQRRRAAVKRAADARVNAIRECVEKVWSLTGGGDVDIATGVLNQAPDGCWFTQSEIAAALQSVAEKKEGEDGPRT